MPFKKPSPPLRCAPPSSSSPFPLLRLPDDVLRQIAVCIDADNDRLSFAEASPVCARLLSAAARHEFHLSPTLQYAERWAFVLSPHVRHLQHSVTYAATPDARRALKHVLSHAALTSATLPRYGDGGLVSQRSLKSLDIRVESCAKYDELLSFLTTSMRTLESLSLSFAFDYSLTHLPPDSRCACHHFRSTPDALALALPALKHFRVSCGCGNGNGNSSSRRVIPYFPQLVSLSLGGCFRAFSPGRNLLRMIPRLDALEFCDSDRNGIFAVSSADLPNPIGRYITAVHTIELSRFSATKLIALGQNCPNLRALRVALHTDAEVGLRGLCDLCASLREISITFPPRKTHFGDGVLFHRLLPRLLDALPSTITTLQLDSVSVEMEDLVAFLAKAGGTLRVLKVPVHAQRELDLETQTLNYPNPFWRSKEVLRAVTRFCSPEQLESLDFQNIAMDEARAAEYLSNVRKHSEERRAVEGAFATFRRRFPYTKYYSVYTAMAEVLRTPDWPPEHD